MTRPRLVRMLAVVALAATLAPAVRAAEPEVAATCAGDLCTQSAPGRAGSTATALPGTDLPEVVPAATAPDGSGTCPATAGGPRADVPPGVCAMEFTLPGEGILQPLPAGSGRAALLPPVPAG